MPIVLDDADRRILDELQRDANRPVAEIALAVGLSQSPCWRRIQRLREAGVILGEVALLDRRAVGLHIQVFAQVRLNAQGRQDIETFSEQIRQFPEVLECFVIMGSIDFLLRIVTPDMEAYERFFLDRLSRVPGIHEISSMVALSEIKQNHALPLAHLGQD